MSILDKIKFRFTARDMLYQTRHMYTSAMGQYINHCYYKNGNFYIAYPKNFNNNMNVVLHKFSGSVFSGGNVIINGIPGEADGHAQPSIILDDSGYIYVARQYNTGETAITTGIALYKSDSPYDLVNFTKIDEVFVGVDEHPYPKLARLNNDIYIFTRYGTGDYTLGVSKIIPSIAFYELIAVGDTYKGYWGLTATEDETRITLSCGILEGTIYNMYRIGVITTTDGVNWTNWQGTWSKNVVADGVITETEFITNCIIENGAVTSHYFCVDSFIKNGDIYLLFEEGNATDTKAEIAMTQLTVRYYNEGWQTAIVPAEISEMPYTGNLVLEQRYHLTYDADGFVLFKFHVTNYNVVTKYKSADLVTWSEGEVIMTSQTPLKFGFYSGCSNKKGIMVMGYHTANADYPLYGGDLLVYKY